MSESNSPDRTQFETNIRKIPIETDSPTRTTNPKSPDLKLRIATRTARIHSVTYTNQPQVPKDATPISPMPDEQRVRS